MRIGGLARKGDSEPSGSQAPGRAGRAHPGGARPCRPDGAARAGDGARTGGAPGRVRAEVAALPLVVVAACAFRAESFVTGVGADEFSLLLMAEGIRDGAFPYETWWDVRPPLAYLFGLPSTFAPDTGRSVAMLRLLALLAHAAAAWTFFCLFCRTLGIGAAAVGALVLLASANATALHLIAVPNHFTMALALLAFAGVVEGARRGSPTLWFASALPAGLLPWVMVHSAPLALSLAVLAGLGGRRPGRGRRWGGWLAVAALPSLAVAGSYFLWGPFEVFVRTVFLAPFGVIDGTLESGYRFFSPEALLRLLRSAPWTPLYVLVLAAGAAWLPGAIRRAPPGTALRASVFLALPLAAGFAVVAAAKPPAPPEYWIDVAPVAALLAAVALAGVLEWPGWTAPGVSRHVRPRVLRACLTLGLGAVLILPIDPWEKVPKPPLPGREYCGATARWAGRVGPPETLLDLNGLCGFKVLDSGAALHPPFAFVHQWFRQLRHAWVGKALAGDGSEAASAARLDRALAPGSGVGVILSDDRLVREVRERGWEESFFREWRWVWFRRMEGRDAEDRHASLGILVRRNAFLRAGRPWPPAPSPWPAGGPGAAFERGAAADHRFGPAEGPAERGLPPGRDAASARRLPLMKGRHHGGARRRVCFVIPTYNEAPNVTPLLRRLDVLYAGEDAAFLIVDDRSPDGTGALVRGFAATHPRVHLLEGRRRGLGDAYARGFAHALDTLGADVIVQMDADFSHDPADAGKLLARVAEGADVAIGSRYAPGGSIDAGWRPRRRRLSRQGNRLARRIAGLGGIRDCTAGFRAIRADALRAADPARIRVKGHAFQIALLHRLVHAGARVVEEGIHFREREHGRTKLGARDLVEFLCQVWRLRLGSPGTFARFALTGLSGVFVNLGSFQLLLVLGVHKLLASPIAIELSIVSNFLLHNYWTFGDRVMTGRKRVRGLKYHLASLGSLALGYGAFAALSALLPEAPPVLLQGCAIPPAMLLNFFLNSRWTFRDASRTGR